jgi:hypothetical protein
MRDRASGRACLCICGAGQAGTHTRFGSCPGGAQLDSWPWTGRVNGAAQQSNASCLYAMNGGQQWPAEDIGRSGVRIACATGGESLSAQTMPRFATRAPSASSLSCAFITFAVADWGSTPSTTMDARMSQHIQHRRTSSAPPIDGKRIASLPAALLDLPFEAFIPAPSASLLEPPPAGRKTHAARQPPHYVPRPRNAFILFRCDFVLQRKVPAEFEKDHRNISRIAGEVWRQLSATQREPWVEMARVERERHAERHPNFSYATKGKKGEAGKKTKASASRSPAASAAMSPAQSALGLHLDATPAQLWMPTPAPLAPLGGLPVGRRRSSSCPAIPYDFGALAHYAQQDWNDSRGGPSRARELAHPQAEARRQMVGPVVPGWYGELQSGGGLVHDTLVSRPR